MRSSFTAPLLAAFGLSTAASAAYEPLTTISPCPECPTEIAPAPITITAQYQPVSTCAPHKVHKKKHYHIEPSCSSYNWVSTTIPCLGGSTSAVITKTEQVVELSHETTVLTSYVPCPTKAPSYNGSYPVYPAYNASCSVPSYQTQVVDVYAPYSECGPLAVSGWEGSGLCKTCSSEGSKYQGVTVVKCLDNECSTYAETWVSSKPTPTPYPTSGGSVGGYESGSSSEAGGYSGSQSGNGGESGYSQNPPSSGGYAGGSQGEEGGYVVAYTTKTIYTVQVSTIVNYDSTILTTVSIPLSTTVCPLETATSNGAVTGYPTGAPITGYPTGAGYPTANPSGTITGYPTAPSSPSTVGNYDFFGCVGSTDDFPTFSLVESSGSMTVELCVSECEASGDSSYAGLYNTDCYCAASLDAGTSVEAANGVCNTPCPGNSLEACGGNDGYSKIFDVYECNLPTATTSTSTQTSTTTSSTPDPSSDYEYETEPEKRNIQADMEVSARKARDVKLRRGGMLRSPSKLSSKAGIAKRDFGLKQPFGL